MRTAANEIWLGHSPVRQGTNWQPQNKYGKKYVKHNIPEQIKTKKSVKEQAQITGVIAEVRRRTWT